LYVRVYKGFS